MELRKIGRSVRVKMAQNFPIRDTVGAVRCVHNKALREACAGCNRDGERPEPVKPPIEATDVMTLSDYVREIERTAAFYKGCALGLGIGSAIGASVIAALVHFFG